MLTTQWNDLGVPVQQVQFQVHNLKTYVCKPTINVKLWFNATIMTYIVSFWNHFTLWGGKPWLPYESSDTPHWGFILWRCVHTPTMLHLHYTFCLHMAEDVGMWVTVPEAAWQGTTVANVRP